MHCCVGGGQEDTSDGFQILSVLPNIGWAFDSAEREICSLCSGSDSDCVHSSLRFSRRVGFRSCFLISCCNYHYDFFVPTFFQAASFELISLNDFSLSLVPSIMSPWLHFGEAVEKLVFTAFLSWCLILILQHKTLGLLFWMCQTWCVFSGRKMSLLSNCLF